MTDIMPDQGQRKNNHSLYYVMLSQQLKTQGFGNIDAFDQSQGALDYSKTLGVYTNYIRDTLDEHQTQIPTGQSQSLPLFCDFCCPHLMS